MRLLRVPFDFTVFAEVAQQRALRSIGALLLLVLLSVGIATTTVSLTMHKAYRELSPMIDQLPTVTIANGKASANVPQPWLRETKEGAMDMILCIDTTGKTTGFLPHQIGMLLTLDKLWLKNQDGKEQSFELSSLGDRVVGPKELHAMAEKGLGLMPWVVGGVTFVWYAIAKTTMAMLLVLVALVGSQRRKKPLGFGGLFAVAVYGMAPAVFLDCAFMLMPFTLPFMWLIYASVAVIWTSLGVQKVPEPQA